MKLRQLTGKIKLRPEGETKYYCERRTDNVLAMYKSVSPKRGARDIAVTCIVQPIYYASTWEST